MSRGNPNQAKLVQRLKEMGYDVRVIHNQICIPGREPMTIRTAKEFIDNQAVGRQTTVI